MNIQEIFNRVIAAGHYSDWNGNGRPLMCPALTEAANCGVITLAESIAAKQEIDKYLCGFGSLGGMLHNKNRDYLFEARLAIYKDWANKPAF